MSLNGQNAVVFAFADHFHWAATGAPVVLGNFVDEVIAAKGIQVLSGTALLFFCIDLIQQVFIVSATYLSEDIGWMATNQLRQDLTFRCLCLDMPFFHQHTPGELIERIDGDVNKLANFFSKFTIQILGNALLMVGILVVLSFQNVWIGASLAVFVGLTLLGLHRIRNLAVLSWELARQASASLLRFLEERVSGADDIHSLGAKDYVLHSLHPLFHQLLRRSQKANVMSAGIVGVNLLAFTLGNVLGLSLGHTFPLRALCRYQQMQESEVLAQFNKVWDRFAEVNAEFSEEEIAADIKAASQRRGSTY